MILKLSARLRRTTLKFDNLSIKSDKILFVEGQDEVNFFEKFLKKHDIENIQIIQTEGKSKFKSIFNTICRLPGFEKIQSFAVIQDADKDACNRFQSICDHLRKNGFKTPDKVASFTTQGKPCIGIFIIPGENKPGMLETLCLSTINTNISDCIDQFMDCVQQYNSNTQIKNKDKARCRAYLSTLKEDSKDLGVAAQKGYWNFKSEKFSLLLSFLKELSSKK